MAYCIRQFAPMEMSHCTVRAFNEYENIISLLEIHCECQAKQAVKYAPCSMASLKSTRFIGTKPGSML